MNKLNYLICFILVFTLSLSLTGATMQQGNPDFNLTQFSYSPNQTMNGFVNFSLKNELSNTIIKATINSGSQDPITKQLSILEFLTDSRAVFDCSQNCSRDYTYSNGQLTKNLNLEKDSEKYVGFVIHGTNIQIKNLSFLISGSGSNTESVCYETPFKLDLLDDNAINFEYKETMDEFCSNKQSSCYNPMYSDDAFFSETTPFCQNIHINKTAKVKVTALMRYWEGVGPEPLGDDVQFSVYDGAAKKGDCVTSFDSLGYDYAECVIGEPDEEGNSDFYIDEAKDYYVCVEITTTAASSYSIKSETTPKLCGFSGFPSSPAQEPIADFSINVSEAKFAPFTTFEEPFDEFNDLQNNLISSIQNYIDEKYSGNCSSVKGCVIPIKIIPSSSQEITLDQAYLKYTENGILRYSNNFYDLIPVEPKINLSMQAISLNAFNLTSPEKQSKTHRLALYYGATSFGTVAFSVEQVPTIESLTPLTVTPNQPTTFSVIVTPSSGKEIINYTWNFGDSTPEQITIIPEVEHTYASGQYNLLIKATDSDSKVGSRTFVINTAVSKESLNQTYLRKKQLSQKVQALGIDSWYQALVYNSTEINQQLDSINLALNSASPDLNSINSQLNSIKIPVSVMNSLSLQESEYFPNKNSINLDYLSELGAGTYDDAEQTKNAIASWQNDMAFRSSATTKKIVFDDASSSEITLVTVKLSGIQEETYFIFSLPSGISLESIKIKENLETTSFSDAFGLILSQDLVLNLAIPSRQDAVSQMNFYASPSFSSLGIEGNPNVKPTPTSLFLPIAAAILVLLILIVLLVMIWKNKKSSGDDFSDTSAAVGTGPFENPADLFNLISYIQSSLSQGKKKKDIEEDLKEQGWNKKQIDFAFKNKDNQNFSQPDSNSDFPTTQEQTSDSEMPKDFDELPDL